MGKTFLRPGLIGDAYTLYSDFQQMGMKKPRRPGTLANMREGGLVFLCKGEQRHSKRVSSSEGGRAVSRRLKCRDALRGTKEDATKVKRERKQSLEGTLRRR